MKSVLNLFVASCFYLASVSAQASHIGSPLPGTTLHFNKNFTLQLVRPNSIEGSTEVGIAIGLLSCPTTEEAVCPSPFGQLGEILFIGQFDPTIRSGGVFYENFTLTVPSADFFSAGRAQLAVARLHLIGAGPAPILELNNITVNLGN
ncbi:hypothetical protein DFH06DRAFT_742267 [Mycena polygramma]|nr:hypothetical protein DFH06DRAFT_742267 [Mycena polygramma]